MSDDRDLEQHGDYLWPVEANVNEDLLYTIPFGSSEVEDLGWAGHVDVAHNLGVEKIDTEVVSDGYNVADGVDYAAVRATVVREDGRVFRSLQAADETTNQVRDHEFVWAVAESRALKRAVKKAYNIVPAKGSVVEGSSVDAPDDVDFDDGHALADQFDEQPSTDGDDW